MELLLLLIVLAAIYALLRMEHEWEQFEAAMWVERFREEKEA